MFEDGSSANPYKVVVKNYNGNDGLALFLAFAVYFAPLYIYLYSATEKYFVRNLKFNETHFDIGMALTFLVLLWMFTMCIYLAGKRVFVFFGFAYYSCFAALYAYNSETFSGHLGLVASISLTVGLLAIPCSVFVHFIACCHVESFKCLYSKLFRMLHIKPSRYEELS